MFDVMNLAQDAIAAYTSALSVSSANIANMSTYGYKRLDVSFQSIFERTLKQGTSASTFAGLGGTNPQQLGQGTAISNVAVDFSQGSFVGAGSIDLGISGRGLFVVSPDGGETYRYTRAGKFRVSSGNLVTESGMQVYGLNSSGSLVPITGLTDYNPNLLSWTATGELAEFTDSSFTTVNRYTGYRIALTYFPNPGGLQQTEGTTFAETAASGSASTPLASGGSAGTVQIKQLEQSNVFYQGEAIDSLEFQRVINANLSVVKMASDLIASVISKF